MPRMPKYLKREWAFFLDERGRKKYNELCRKCERSCKQSFRAAISFSSRSLGSLQSQGSSPTLKGQGLTEQGQPFLRG